jgi:hypothetical protein
MTMFEGSGITGAKRASWEHYNPRDIVLRMLQEHPEANEKALTRHLYDFLVGDAVLDDECFGYLMACLKYTVHNALIALGDEKKEARRKARAEARAQREKEGHTDNQRELITQSVREKFAQYIAKITLLDMLMPNGKILRDCTGRECTVLGPQIGVWLAKIGARIKPDDTVGDSLSEEQVQQIYGTRNGDGLDAREHVQLSAADARTDGADATGA